MTWAGRWSRARIGPFVVRMVTKGPPLAWSLDVYVFGAATFTGDRALLGQLALDYTARHIKSKQPVVTLYQLRTPAFGSRFARCGIGTLLMNTAIQYLKAQDVQAAQLRGEVSRRDDPALVSAPAWQVRRAFFAGFGVGVEGAAAGGYGLTGRVWALRVRSDKRLFDQFPAWVALADFTGEPRVGRPEELF